MIFVMIITNDDETIIYTCMISEAVIYFYEYKILGEYECIAPSESHVPGKSRKTNEQSV